MSSAGSPGWHIGHVTVAGGGGFAVPRCGCSSRGCGHRWSAYWFL